MVCDKDETDFGWIPGALLSPSLEIMNSYVCVYITESVDSM